MPVSLHINKKEIQYKSRLDIGLTTNFIQFRGQCMYNGIMFIPYPEVPGLCWATVLKVDTVVPTKNIRKSNDASVTVDDRGSIGRTPIIICEKITLIFQNIIILKTYIVMVVMI